MMRFSALLPAVLVLALLLLGCDTGINREAESVTDVSKGGGLDDEQGNEGTTSKVRLHTPEPGDGDVEGLLTITDNGDRVRVTGTVRGLDPDKQYITLFQGRGSEARGPRACEPVSIPSNPGDPEDALRPDQRRVGGWTVGALGRGGLRALVWGKLFEGSGVGEGYSGPYELRDRPPEMGDDVPRNGSPDYVPLHEVGTVSIRGLSSSGPLDRVGFGPEAVVACGDVAV